MRQEIGGAALRKLTIEKGQHGALMAVVDGKLLEGVKSLAIEQVVGDRSRVVLTLSARRVAIVDESIEPAPEPRAPRMCCGVCGSDLPFHADKCPNAGGGGQ